MAVFPKTYDVPRGGDVVRVTVHEHNELRRLRTELELLRRTHRHACSQRASFGPRLPGKYSDDDVAELGRILDDARSPVVVQMVSLIDEEFGDVRKEIMMSVVNDEAEKLAREAAEAGVASPDPAADGTEPIAAIPPEMDEALALAEAELAKAAGGGVPVQAPTDAIDATDTAIDSEMGDLATESEDLTTPPSSDDDQVIDTAEDTSDTSGMPECDASLEEVDASGPDSVAEAPSDRPEGDADSLGEVDASDSERSPEDVHEHQTPVTDGSPEQKSTGRFDLTDAPERAELAINDIESGIRKLAGVLSTEVNDQWGQAKQALEDVTAIRANVEQLHQESRRILEELSRTKEEAAIARADADVARREAKLFREDAKRAKERADSSAEAAERAANQAQREAEAVCGVAAAG